MIFHKIFYTRYEGWGGVEEAIKVFGTDEEKDALLAQFAFAYFTYFQNIYQVRDLFLENDIPEACKMNWRLERKNDGANILLILEDGTLVACRAKFMSTVEVLSYETAFLEETVLTAERCIFTNCDALPQQVYQKGQFAILRGRLTALDQTFFSWLSQFASGSSMVPRAEKYHPLPHQKKLIQEVLDGFVNADRGKLLAACGAGKTLTALWILEALDCHMILYAAPNLGLVKQTLEAWMAQADKIFSYLCVCSDETVAQKQEIDWPAAECLDMDVPVTTEPETVEKFLRWPGRRNKVIFSTYQSLNSVSTAVSAWNGFAFDIAFFDEAHRTAGSKDSGMFLYGMEDEYIPCKKRLFMTATERFVNPRIARREKRVHYEVLSMDDPKWYGPTFTALPFREAIDQGIISEYKIVLCCMNKSGLKKILQEQGSVYLDGQKVDVQTLFRQVLLAKTMNDLGIHKVISYHGSIEAAKRFIHPEGGVSLAEILSNLSSGIDKADVYGAHINGAMPAGMRKEIFDAFARAPYGLISNARCLTEGVDVPIVDAVYFAEPKNSIIDIVQAVGRCLRKDKNKPEKTSYIIIPMVIPEQVTKFEDIDPKEFGTLHAVVQALRDQDRILAEYIDRLNLKAAEGVSGFGIDPNGPILVTLSKKLNLIDFSNSLSLRIAEVNCDPSTIGKEFIVKKGERKSGVKRTFRTIGDYTVGAYCKNLVLPTLEAYQDRSLGLPRQAIERDHNNISHCEKIGALEQKDDQFYVTEIGEAMLDHREQYVKIFQEQMLKYYELDKATQAPKFPYRMVLRVLAKLRHLTQVEYGYSLYITKYFGTRGVEEAINRVEYLRATYPNMETLSDSNKEQILKALNENFNTTFKYGDIWTSSSTVYNQFNFLKGHLLTWDRIFAPRSGQDSEIRLLVGGEKQIEAELAKSAEIESCPLDSLRKNYIQYKGY